MKSQNDTEAPSQCFNCLLTTNLVSAGWWEDQPFYVSTLYYIRWVIAIVYPHLACFTTSQVPKLSNDLTSNHLRHSALQFGGLA